MSTTHWLSLLFVVGFIAVHFTSKYVKLSTSSPRSLWFSTFGGAALAYVFLILLPELNKYLERVKTAVESWTIYLDNYTYLLALFGLLLYYGMDMLAKSKDEVEDDSPPSRSFPVLLVHMTAFFLYNVTIGYLLVREEFSSYMGMVTYFIALSAHFIATDFTLKEIHEKNYEKYGRWLLSAAILIGWLIGITLKVHEVAVSIAVSLLAGGIIFNVFKDELKEGTFKNYFAFLGGALTIAALVTLFRS